MTETKAARPQGTVIGLWAFALWVFAASNAAAALEWNYTFTTQAGQVGAGTFTTDRDATDAQSGGDLTYTVSSFNSFFLDGVDVSGDFATPPSLPIAGFNTFNWNSNTSSVTGTGSAVGSIAGGDALSIFAQDNVGLRIFGTATAAFSGFLIDRDGFLTATTTTPTATIAPQLAPVPEPGETALIAGLGLAGFIAWRRRRKSASNAPA